MAADTKFDICSRALVSVGAPPITSFEDGSTGAVSAALFYDSTKRQLLAKHPWRFASKSAVISKLALTPDSKYSAAYQLPGLVIRITNLRYGTTKIDPFEIFGDQVHCDSSFDQLDLDYVQNVNEDAMTEWFVEILETSLAAKFAMSVTESPSKAGFYSEQAALMIRQAKFTDSLQDTPNTIEPTRLITMRR